MHLALLCRIFNNKLFLKCDLELRPGYLAKWIEVRTIPADTDYANMYKVRLMTEFHRKSAQSPLVPIKTKDSTNTRVYSQLEFTEPSSALSPSPLK